MKPSILPTAVAVAALAFAAAAVVPAYAQMKEQTVTVGGAPMYPSKNIIQNAVNSKDHTTLVAAVKAAGLVETLQGPGPFTVFAPTNTAFQKLAAGTVDSLLKPQMKEKLTAVLTYHVLPRPALGPGLVGGLQQGRWQGQVQDRRRRRAHSRVQGPSADHPRCQGQCVARDHPERVPVERRHPRHRQRVDAELTSLAFDQLAQPSAYRHVDGRPRRSLAAGFSFMGSLASPIVLAIGGRVGGVRRRVQHRVVFLHTR
jgi:uncharacterized surface protein with fasciclin (FAS1) repeats